MTRQRLSFSEVTLAVFVGYFVTTLAGVALGCGSSLTPEEQSVAAELKYGAQQSACVAEAGTLADSRACRASVDLAWGITHAHPGVPGSMLSTPSPLPSLDGGAR